VEYPEDIDEALKSANLAIEKMREIGVPSNPNNFTIWFHYFSGTYPDLKRTLDILLGNKQEFTETRNSEIFQKFFTLDQENATLHDATTRVESELGRIVSSLSKADDEFVGLKDALLQAEESLDQSPSSDDLRVLTTGLKDRISSVLVHTTTLEEKLKSSSKEINVLKDDLERMRREAMTDGLTGIANRKLFDLELRKAAMNAMANGEDLALVMIDVDHFKRFNEHYGHQVGDQVLKLVAVTIGECIKGQDTAARYGGEEFAVILPRTNLENAVRLAEHICKRISAKNVVNRATGERLGKVTMSAGAALFEYGEPVGQLLVRSDTALIAAKNQGRNRVLSQLDLEGSAA
jgi:diguanylate cyclase